MKIWDCKIGEIEAANLPLSSDAPMRRAVEKAYFELTGQEPNFVLSGWGGELTDTERMIVEEPNSVMAKTPHKREDE